MNGGTKLSFGALFFKIWTLGKSAPSTIAFCFHVPRYFCLLLSCVALVLSAFKNRAVHLCTAAVSLGCIINLRGDVLVLFSALVRVSLNWDL